MTPFRTLAEARDAHNTAGGHFFDRASMRFFDSRIESALYGGRYFITSEQFHDGSYHAVRGYTIREVKADTSIDTVDRFQAYATLAEARSVARTMSKEP